MVEGQNFKASKHCARATPDAAAVHRPQPPQALPLPLPRTCPASPADPALYSPQRPRTLARSASGAGRQAAFSLS